jgi:hypothetical protein
MKQKIHQRMRTVGRHAELLDSTSVLSPTVAFDVRDRPRWMMDIATKRRALDELKQRHHYSADDTNSPRQRRGGFKM